MLIIYTKHARQRSQQRDIDVNLVIMYGEFRPQMGGEGCYLMLNKTVDQEIFKRKRKIKKIKDGCEKGSVEDIRLIKYEMQELERVRGCYVAITSDGVIKTCCHSTSRYQKLYLSGRKIRKRRRGRRTS